jgi:HAD superfamily hydrolase (TIGR01509 family)
MTRAFDLVIFDCDGVLIDSEPIANRVLAEHLATVGISLDFEEVMHTFVGRTRDGCLEVAAELLGRTLPERFAEEWDRALFEAFNRELRPVDGVAEVLARLNLPYCAASNSSPERMRVSLSASGLLPFFEGRMFSAALVAHPKPAPDLFLHAANAFSTPPSRCAVIEDTPTGTQAGIAAGMTVYAYAGAAHARPDVLEALGATPFTRMDALPGLLSL